MNRNDDPDETEGRKLARAGAEQRARYDMRPKVTTIARPKCPKCRGKGQVARNIICMKCGGDGKLPTEAGRG